MVSNVVTLSNIKPSYEQIYDQLSSRLQTKNSWLTLNKSATATMMLEAISAIGESSQFSVMSAAQETMLETAKTSEAVYYAARFLGVRISRKIPAKATVKLQNTNYENQFLEIPKFTQFDVNGTKCFNRETIIFNNSNDTITTTLYEGEVKQLVYSASGDTYQSYILSEDDQWVISNEDILCYVNDIEYSRSEDPIFLYSASDAKFYENSLPDGSVECKFGNGVYGLIPSSQSSITFIYAVTSGSDGNNSISNLEVSCSEYSTIVGETTSNFYDGGDEKDLKFYKELGSQAGASNGRCIIRDDFKPIIIQYPGVIDCNVYGQAEIAPNDKDWMNVIGLMLLVDDSFTDNSWKNLISSLKTKRIWGFQFKRFYPQKVSIDINLTLNLKTTANISKCRDLVVAALNDYMELGVNSLGKSLCQSDLDNLALTTIPNDLDYMTITSPTVDYLITKNQYISVNSITVNAVYTQRSLG